MRAGSRFLILCIALASGSAHAQPSTQAAAATAQFDKGRALIKEKKWPEACAAFEQSQKLDPQNGTLFNLAGCYTHIGKLASAWAAYKELAQVDTNDKRKKQSMKEALSLEKRLPKLVLKAGAPAPGLVVTLDGADVTGLLGSDSPIDLGTHQVHASAPKLKDFDQTVTISDEGKTVTVVVELATTTPKHEPTPPPVVTQPKQPEPVPTKPIEPEPEPHAEQPRSHRKLYGIIVAAGGGALVATGLVFGQLANGKWADAKKLCPNMTCGSDADLMKGNQLVSDARSQANISTGLVIGGAVAVGVGIVLIVTAPHAESQQSAWRITPSASPTAMGFTLDGRF